MNTETAQVEILIVGDHQLLCQGLRQLISSHPGLAVVGEACNGEDALRQIRSANPEVVVMDIPLTSEDGVELARRLLAEFPGVRLVAISSDSELPFVLRALHCGVSGFILKQNGSDELIRAIRAVMAGQLYLSPEVSSAVIRDFLKTSSVGRTARPACTLSVRERMLLQLVSEGKRNKEIAANLAIAVKSAETYRARLMQKLGCGSTAELVRYAIREGIIQP